MQANDTQSPKSRSNTHVVIKHSNPAPGLPDANANMTGLRSEQPEQNFRIEVMEIRSQPSGAIEKLVLRRKFSDSTAPNRSWSSYNLK